MKDITIQGVTKSFESKSGTVEALSPIDIAVEPSEFVAIVGPSGCGKSTLLNIVAGLLPATDGTVSSGGTEITGPSSERVVVFQKFALFPSMTVWRNVEYGLRMKKIPVKERARQVEAQLAGVGLSDFAKAYPHQLSGGMQQRVAIARALILRPEVFLLDEPFGALDAQTRVVMQEDLSDMTQDLRSTTMLITHSVEEAVYLADRVIVMTKRPGQIKKIIENPGAREWRSSGVDHAMQDPDFIRVREEAWTLVREEITVVGRHKTISQKGEVA